MPNKLMVISPYRKNGTWVFDDDAVGLYAEPFVAGIPEMIDDMVKRIPNAKKGFRLIFSSSPFSGFTRELTWVREEYGGNWYKLKGTNTEGWLCPALFCYFQEAPIHLYVRAEGR